MSAVAAATIWHDLECGAYAADLPLWEELAAGSGGPVLDLGCGTGRVALALARAGRRVVGLDLDPELVEEARRRAGDLPARFLRGDARDFALDESFPLVLAPMQLLQLFGDAAERRGCLSSLAAHLSPGGLFAAALVEEVPSAGISPSARPLPDVCEVDGSVYSSFPVAIEGRGGEIRVRRVRQAAAPDGSVGEETDEVVLRRLAPEALAREAAPLGLRHVGRRRVPATDEHVGSTVVLLGKGGR